MNEKRRPGRPKKHACYEELSASLKAGDKKRPTYVSGIGLFKGTKGETAWVKLTLRRPNQFKGRSYSAGQSVEISLGAKTSWTWDQLEAERNRLQGLADRGEPLEEVPTVNFATYASEWLELKRPNLRGADIPAGHIRKHLSPAFGKLAMGDICVADIDRWASKQLKTHKPGSVQRQLTTLKSILNHAVKHGLIERNPANHAEPIRGIEPRSRWLSPDELKAVFETAEKIEAEENERDSGGYEIKGWIRDFVLWALHSGMRRGEVLSLRYSDIRIGHDGRCFVSVEKTKTGKPRQVTATLEMQEIAKRLLKLPRKEGDDRLFPVSLTTAKRKLSKLWKACDLGDVRLHDIRRTHATGLAAEGVPMRELAGRLGHRDLAMLEKHYAVFLPDQRAAERTEDIWKF